MNTKNLNGIFARALYVVAILALTLGIASPVSADSKTLTGDKIRVRDGSITFPLNTPFYISHGWIQPSTDDAIGVFDFKLEVDGSLNGESFKMFSAESGDPDNLSRIWVYNFPNGMTGMHTFTGHWFAPCQYAVDYLGYGGSCATPNEKVETSTRTLTITFVP